MAKNKAPATKPAFTLVELLAFLFSLGYFQSVLTVANHVAGWIHNGTLHRVDRPAIPALVISLLLLAYSWKKEDAQAHILTFVTLTLLACATVFWISGLRTNFYF